MTNTDMDLALASLASLDTAVWCQIPDLYPRGRATFRINKINIALCFFFCWLCGCGPRFYTNVAGCGGPVPAASKRSIPFLWQRASSLPSHRVRPSVRTYLKLLLANMFCQSNIKHTLLYLLQRFCMCYLWPFLYVSTCSATALLQTCFIRSRRQKIKGSSEGKKCITFLRLIRNLCIQMGREEIWQNCEAKSEGGGERKIIQGFK